MRARVVAGLAGLAAAAALAVPLTGHSLGPLGSSSGGSIDVFVGSTPTATAGQSCTGADVTTGTFASRVSGSTNGDTLCLLNGSYGSFTGTSKTITIAAKTGQTAVNMSFSFGSGDSGFTLDGMKNMSGGFTNGATSITVRNSTFTGAVDFAGASTDGIVMDGNTHNFNVTDEAAFGTNAKLFLDQTLTGTVASPSVTIENSEIKNGVLDGIHIGGGSGYVIQGNTLENLCNDPDPLAHTDNIQFDANTFSEILIKANFLNITTAPCETQGIASYDGGVNGAIIEDNVISIYRQWGIEMNGSTNVIIRHNTMRYRANSTTTNNDSTCEFFNQTCGWIFLGVDHSSNPSTGAHVYDNIATFVDFTGGSTGTQDHNMCRQSGCTGTGTLNSTTPIYVGGIFPTTYLGYCLDPSSPGKNAASDGLDIGIRC